MNRYRAYIVSLAIVSVAVCALAVTPLYAQEAGADPSSELFERMLEDIQNATTTVESVSAGFSRDGVYGCTGAAYGSVGMQGPGGAHVPTFDDAQFDQQRLLTYKECLLDGIASSMRETLVSFIIQSVVRWSNQGFDGNPAYVSNLPLHLTERIGDPEAERIITGEDTEVIPELFRRDVRVQLSRSYARDTRRPHTVLECDLSSEQLEALAQGDIEGAGGTSAWFRAMQDEGCNPLFSFLRAQDHLRSSVAAEQERELRQLDWGSGFRSVEVERTVDLGDGTQTTVRRIVTPGFMIAEHLRQVIGTGLRQSENADEIDEIISALMSNIGTEMLTDIEGLSGLSAVFGGRAPYVDRIAQDSAQRTRGNMTGAAVSIMNNTIRVEQEYAQTRRDSVNVLSQGARQLVAWEATCWASIAEQARLDLRERVQERVCGAQGGQQQGEDDEGTPACTVTASVSEALGTDAIGVEREGSESIVVYGRASAGGATVDVTAQGGGVLAGPVQPQVRTDGNWSTAPLDLSAIPDGAITVTVRETAAGAGSGRTFSAQVQKTTTITGVDLVLPTAKPSLTITATAQSVSESATIATSTTRSRNVITQNITPLLTLLRDNIARANQALAVLAQLRNTLAATSSASAQRFLLERLDQLVAARVLHTQSQLRQARDQAQEIEGAMQQLLEQTRERWEAGWCDLERWEQHAQ